MRNFSWKYFTLTGDVESYMLYKEMDQLGIAEHPNDIAEEEGELSASFEQQIAP
ncbi:YqzL family protein [Paenibacillus sp. NEAU-GSW1]|uniref:YqzL family protein n=1 Tax=Paenibacillus sp. NEAU-GSW1 TaxID=2682486 RepID=UPI0012E153E2|nr:YqzL family protein [Paenibacillus sp. NEAU-GSW1]MUT66681.1 YqzL family protein [Paenibacillus sp. NEAU-GSW1]